MTVPAFGRCTPVQIALLELAGYDLRRRGPTLVPDERGRITQMMNSRRELVRTTGQDFGYDLKAWREFLLAGGKEHGYTHPYAFRSVEKAVQKVLNDAGFRRWVELASAAST